MDFQPTMLDYSVPRRVKSDAYRDGYRHCLLRCFARCMTYDSHAECGSVMSELMLITLTVTSGLASHWTVHSICLPDDAL